MLLRGRNHGNKVGEILEGILEERLKEAPTANSGEEHEKRWDYPPETYRKYKEAQTKKEKDIEGDSPAGNRRRQKLGGWGKRQRSAV
jgi:hypothetical protein